ncbi:MAG TPA: hypothetical protein VFC39_18840 [Acidobacteriaceae bacterium]|nr:hypothetical protein [Acidobacteriaceae bacterium]
MTIGLLRKLTCSFVLLAAYPRQTSAPVGNDASIDVVTVGQSKLQVELSGATPDMSRAAIDEGVRRAALAVATYYGRFPVASARVRIVVAPDRSGVMQGTTWGNVDGFPALTRIRLGQHTTEQEFYTDWKLTHELTHMALADQDEQQAWLEEGIASYVEPIARGQAGQMTPEQVWQGMVDGMPNGEPETGDQGLNRTHSWGRTYWGGAMFCLVADIEIRKQTHNARGLQDALRGIVETGGTIDTDWPVGRVLSIGDKATGTRVLEDLYAKWSGAPVEVDLAKMWQELGIRVQAGKIVFDDAAPLAGVRRAIVAPPQNPAADRHKFAEKAGKL